MAADRGVSKSILLRYGTGQLGAQIFRDTPAVLLPIFMTTILGVPAWLSGLSVLLPKLWLIVCDPLMGSFSDRAKPRFGRTPFLAVGALLTSVGFVSLFIVTDYTSPVIATAAICLIFFLGSTAFSAFSVPYLAIASELTADPHERTRILMFRMMFTIAGLFLGVGVAQPLVFHFGGGAHGWHIMATCFGLLCFVAMMVPALGLRKVTLIDASGPSPRFRDQLTSVFSNRAYKILIATTFLQGIGQSSSYTVIGFIYLYALQAVGIIPFFVMCFALGSVLTQPLWLRLSRRYGKERCYIATSLIWVVVTVTWFFLRPGGAILMSLPFYGPLPLQHALVLIRGFILGATNSGFVLLSLSMLTDTIDNERERTGIAHEGVFSGFFSATEKLTFALGPVIAGIVLSLSGFISSTGGPVPQSASAVTGILLLYSLIPAAAQLLSLLVFLNYRLDRHDPVPARIALA